MFIVCFLPLEFKLYLGRTSLLTGPGSGFLMRFSHIWVRSGLKSSEDFTGAEASTSRWLIDMAVKLILDLDEREALELFYSQSSSHVVTGFPSKHAT